MPHHMFLQVFFQLLSPDPFDDLRIFNPTENGKVFFGEILGLVFGVIAICFIALPENSFLTVKLYRGYARLC